MHALLFLALHTASVTTSTQASTPAAARPRLLVLDFKNDGAGESNARVVRDILVAQVSRDKRLDVISAEDMRRAIDVDAQKRAVGACTDDGCVAEIANALGAQLTMYGTAGKLGDLYVVNVSLFDARTATSVGRETVEAKGLGDLPGPLRDAADRLIAQLTGLPPSTASAASSAGGFGALAWTGVAVAALGAGTAIVAGLLGAANQGTIDDVTSDFAHKNDALHTRNVATGIAIVALSGVVLGGGVLGLGLALE